MCIQYLHHGSSIVELAFSLSSHSPILMNMMFKEFKSNAKTKGGYSSKAKIINEKKKQNPKSMSTDLYYID